MHEPKQRGSKGISLDAIYSKNKNQQVELRPLDK